MSSQAKVFASFVLFEIVRYFYFTMFLNFFSLYDLVCILPRAFYEPNLNLHLYNVKGLPAYRLSGTFGRAFEFHPSPGKGRNNADKAIFSGSGKIFTRICALFFCPHQILTI